MMYTLHNDTDSFKTLITRISIEQSILPEIIEKDYFVTLILQEIAEKQKSYEVFFKGGTALYKALKSINRFSEDIDLVLDRAVLGYTGDLSKNKIKALRRDSCIFISGEFREVLEKQLLVIGVPAQLFSLTVKETTEHDRDPQVLVLNYTSALDKDPYLREAVLIEIGARSLREPAEQREISSLIGQTLENDEVAGAPFRILTVTPPRTFLEKIFLLHEEFSKAEEKVKSERMSRHFYDIERIMRTEYAEQALNDKELYQGIIAHREKFNALRGLDYSGHQPAKIRFLPPEALLKDWEADYRAMRESMFYGESLPFSELIDRLRALQKRINELPD